MRHTKHHTELGALVAAAIPHTDSPTHAEVERVWNAVLGRSMVEPAPRRAGRRALTAVGIATVLLGTSGIAAAGVYTAHTGKGPVDSEDRAVNGPGERLNPAAPDFKNVVREETRDIPFPDDRIRAEVVDRWATDLSGWAHHPANELSSDWLRAWVAGDAVCSWANQWAAASRDGDTDARAEAAEHIENAPHWPAIQAVDPQPYSKRVEFGTENHLVRSQFYYLGPLRQAIGGGSTNDVARALRLRGWGCWPNEVPDLPAADPGHRDGRVRGH